MTSPLLKIISEKSAVLGGLRLALSNAVSAGFQGKSLQAITAAIVEMESEIQQMVDEVNSSVDLNLVHLPQGNSSSDP